MTAPAGNLPSSRKLGPSSSFAPPVARSGGKSDERGARGRDGEPGTSRWRQPRVDGETHTAARGERRRVQQLGLLTGQTMLSLGDSASPSRTGVMATHLYAPLARVADF